MTLLTQRNLEHPTAMLAFTALAAGLVVGPGARLHVRKVELRMCEAEERAAPAPAGRSPSVLTEMKEKFKESMGGFMLDELKEEMKEAYAGIAGNEDAEIDLAQFTTLMASLGDPLPAEKLKAVARATGALLR